MQENFRVAVDTLIKLLVSVLGLVETNVVRDDEGRLGASGDDEIAQVAVIFLNTYASTSLHEARSGGSTHLDVALTGADSEALLEELAEREVDVALG